MRSTPIFVEGLGFESCVKYLVDEKSLSANLAQYYVIEVSQIHVRLNFIHQPLKRSKLISLGLKSNLLPSLKQQLFLGTSVSI